MGEYLFSVLCALVMLGFVGYLSYPNSERTVQNALSVLLLCVVLTPIFGIIGKINDFNIDGIFDMEEYTPPSGEGVESVSEDAFCEGIKKLVSEKFSLEITDISVNIYGFDFEKMNAKKIKILLSGGAAFSDYRRIESYITESGLGECEVNVKFE